MSGLRAWRFGIVGTGLMAAGMMECLALSPRVSVATVASGDARRAREFAARFGIGAFDESVAALIARDDIDAVYIANATRDHAATAIAALAAGKAVLCEKPFAITAAEGLRVADAARTHKRLFMEAQWTPALPAYQALRQLVVDGSLGTPTHLYSEFGVSLDAASHPRLFEGPGSGVLLDFGVYPIVLALQLLGPVAAVRATVVYNRSGTDVQASLQLAHTAGGQSQLAASLVAAMPNASALSCSRGTVSFDSPVMGVESLQIRRTAPAHGSASSAARGGARQRVVAALRRQPWMRRFKAALSRDERSRYGYGANRYLPQLLHFVALLDAGALASDLMSIDTSIEVLRIIDSARRDAPLSDPTIAP